MNVRRVSYQEMHTPKGIHFNPDGHSIKMI